MFTIIHSFVAYLHSCNLHFCLYGALGGIFIWRAILALRDKKHDEAREHWMTGFFHILIAMLWL